jgi:hypothetical protein
LVSNKIDHHAKHNETLNKGESHKPEVEKEKPIKKLLPEPKKVSK